MNAAVLTLKCSFQTSRSSFHQLSCSYKTDLGSWHHVDFSSRCIRDHKNMTTKGLSDPTHWGSLWSLQDSRGQASLYTAGARQSFPGPSGGVWSLGLWWRSSLTPCGTASWSWNDRTSPCCASSQVGANSGSSFLCHSPRGSEWHTKKGQSGLWWGIFRKCRVVNMKTMHLFSSNHGDDGDTLFPHHLPEVLTRVWQRTLRGNVAPLLSTYYYLMTQDTSHQSQNLISDSPKSWELDQQNTEVYCVEDRGVNVTKQQSLPSHKPPNTPVQAACLLLMSRYNAQEYLDVWSPGLNNKMNTLCTLVESCAIVSLNVNTVIQNSQHIQDYALN